LGWLGEFSLWSCIFPKVVVGGFGSAVVAVCSCFTKMKEEMRHRVFVSLSSGFEFFFFSFFFAFFAFLLFFFSFSFSERVFREGGR
jgi:hypothetical protein